jgi:hypothetical protein
MSTLKYYDLNSLPDIWDREDKQEWVVEGFIPKNAVTVLTGATGSGKSTVALAVANAVAQGEPFLDHKTEQSMVLFVDRENPLYVYTERFDRLSIEKTPNIKFWGIWDSDLEPQGPDYIGIEKFIEEHHPLIFFDSLVAFHPESEQDASETRRYMHLFRKLAGKGCSVVIIHHVGKSTEGVNKFYRGSSDIPANADVAWLLEQKSDKPLKSMKLTKFKSREGILADMYFGFDDGQFVLSEFIKDDDPLYKQIDVIIESNPGINQTALCEKFPEVSRTKLRKMLDLAAGSHRYTTQKGLKNATYYFMGVKEDTQKSVILDNRS